MLQFIRGAVGTWVVKILFAVLIASFAIWGIGDIFRSHGPTTTVAEIGPIKIPASELEHEFQQQMDRLRRMFGGQFDMEQAKRFGLVDQTVGEIVQRSLLDLAAKDAGLMVGDDLVRQRIQQLPGFRNEQGQFDSERLLRALSANGLSEGAFGEMIREETGRQLVSNAVTAGAFAPKPLVEILYRYHQERRVAETLTLANDAMPDPGAADDAALTRIYEDKITRFTAPEYRTLTVGTVTLDDLAKTIHVSEDDLKTAYEARADEFQLPERRSFQQVLVDSEDKARKIAEAARAAHNDLTAVAKTEGASVSELGPASETDVPEIGVSIFALEPNIIPDPFKSGLGWHVVKVTKIEPARVRSLDEVRADVESQLRKDRAADAMPTLTNSIEDALAGGATLEEAATKFKFALTKLDMVDATGAKPDGSRVAESPDLVHTLQTAFELAQGAHSPVTEGTDNSAFVVRVDGITPSHPRPLAEVRDQVTAVWKAEQQAKAAVAKAEDVETRLKSGEAIDAVAKATGAVLAITPPITRDSGQDAKLPADIVKALFTLTPGGETKGATPDGQVVVKLKDILPADPKAADAPLNAVRDAALKGISGDLMDEFGDALRLQYPVRINRERIQSLFSSN